MAVFSIKDLLIGEIIGTFILVFIGCSSVAIAVTGIQDLSLWQVALIWGIAVFFAIKASSRWCYAHLNPAVTLAFHLSESYKRKELLAMLSGQALGALLAGVMILLVFDSFIIDYELSHNLTRGNYPSYNSAQMFGEFYPNPAFEGKHRVSEFSAMLFEGIGTMALMFVILMSGKLPKSAITQPLAIAITLSLLIYVIAPFTQAGFNPFRDFMPRMVAFVSGWGIEAFPMSVKSAFTVYILSPILGSCIASMVYKRYIY
jgi:glycerol uptake facilitator protein